MRKFLQSFLVLTIALVPAVYGQTFTTSTAATGDTAYANGTGTLHVNNYLKSTGDPVVLNWNVSNFSPNLSITSSEWVLDGVCDNILCYIGAPLLAGQTYTTDPYDSMGFSTFYALLDATAAPVNSSAWLQVVVKDANTPAISRTLTFIGTKKASGITQTTVLGDGIQLYPNPAGPTLFVTIPDNMNLNSVAVYSMEGREVLAQTVSGKGVMVIPVDQLASGNYFLRFLDISGNTVATRRFMH